MNGTLSICLNFAGLMKITTTITATITMTTMIIGQSDRNNLDNRIKTDNSLDFLKLKFILGVNAILTSASGVPQVAVTQEQKSVVKEWVKFFVTYPSLEIRIILLNLG